MVKKRIVCLANSRMKPGRCIAGKDIESGSWIRLVNGNPGEGLSEREYQYGDGSDPKKLDIIEVPLTEHHPRGHQSENWLLDPIVHLTRKGRVAWSDLAKLADDPKVLWRNDFSRDRVPPDMAENFSCSLYLIRVQDMAICGGSFSKKQVRGMFTHYGDSYDLAVTDPAIESEYTTNGEYTVEECYVTVSLAAEPYLGNYYKLIAAIITPKRAGERTR